MSVPFVTGNVTATDCFILLYYYIRDLGLLCVNSGLLYLSCMLIGFGFLGNKLFVTTADRLRAVLDNSIALLALYKMCMLYSLLNKMFNYHHIYQQPNFTRQLH